MSNIKSGQFKRRKRNPEIEEWHDQEEEEKVVEPRTHSESDGNTKDQFNKDQSHEDQSNKNSSRYEESLLFPNKISLKDVHKEVQQNGEDKVKEGNEDDKNEVSGNINFDQLRLRSRQKYLSERERRQMMLLKEELKGFERDIKEVGWKNMSEQEHKEYQIKKEIMSIFERRSQLEEEEKNGGGSFLIEEDYVNDEGRIDMKRKDDALVGRNPHAQFLQGEDPNRNRSKQLTKFSNLKKAESQKKNEEYDYIFDQSQAVNFTDDGDDENGTDSKLTSNEKVLLEKIRREEERVKTIEETRKSLPVFLYRDQLIEAVKKYPVLIVVGETGSGKTTQLPQYLYEAGFDKGPLGKPSDRKDGTRFKIGCTQPRRVAATAVASRVADEVGTRVGDKVGYSIRFDDKTSENTVIKYMTDGMLLREFMSDPDLSSYSVMMVDEAHERTLHTDILLGLLKELSLERPNFRLLISSATMDSEKFSAYFNDAPIFNVPGRRFPVSIHYTMQPEANYLHAATTTVFQIHFSQESGDILVFLTGQDEIETMATNLRATCDKLAGQMKRRMIVCPIYANLPQEQQKLIFMKTPENARKVVLATNIAETSLTIDGISYVVDCGFVKEDRYSPVTGIQSLTVVPCSRASADQRAGRAGRTGPGKCFRLYTRWSYMNEMTATPTPEILRTNLSGVVLQMESLGITDLIHFDFLDSPSPEALIKALEQLYSLGSLNEKGELTQVGGKMAELPCDPMLSRCLLASGKQNCCTEVVSIISMLEEANSIFYGRTNRKDGESSTQPSAATSAQKFRARADARLGGDHLTLLEIWNQFATNGFSPQWCRDNFIQYRAMNRARNVRNQLEKLCKKLNLYGEEELGDEFDTKDEFSANTVIRMERMPQDERDRLKVRIMKSFARGFFANAAKLSKSGDYYQTLKKHQPVYVHPSSALFKMVPPPKYVIYNELMLTSKEFMRNCMPVSERWLREYAPHYYGSQEVK